MSKEIELIKSVILADVLEVITSPTLTPERLVELGHKYQDLANNNKNTVEYTYYFSASRLMADLSHVVLSHENDLRVAGLALKKLAPLDQLVALSMLKLPEADMNIIMEAAGL